MLCAFAFCACPAVPPSQILSPPMKTQKKRGRPKGEQPALTATERNQLRRQKNKDEGLVRIDCYVPDEVLKAVRDRYPDTIDKLITRGLKLLLSAKG